MSKKVSMKDIAQEVGVSVALVSYVLNGKFTNRINVETAERIRELALKYDYTPNQIAKSLKSNKTYTIGLVVADISNLFYSAIAHHIEEEVNKLGYNVLFGSAYEDPLRFKSVLDIFIAKQVDGLILAVPEGADKYLSKVEQSKIPYVILDREFEGIDKNKIVNIDNYLASETVVKHLTKNGFHRIGAVALQSNLIHLNNRKAGFVETVQKLTNEPALFYEIQEKDLQSEIEEVVLKAVQVDKVDALYFFTNRIAMAGLAVLAKYDIDVPQSVGVVCFDEAEAYHIFKTPLTYVQQPLAEMSKEAVEKILTINKEYKSSSFKTSLVVQSSSVK